MTLRDRRPARSAAALVLAAALMAACGDDSSAGGEVTLEQQLTGAWNGLGIEQDGDFTPTDEGTYSGLVFRSDGSGAFFSGEGAATVEKACSQESSLRWRLSDDKSSILVRAGENLELVWTIVEIDAKSLTFDEGSDLFPFDRLGSCE